MNETDTDDGFEVPTGERQPTRGEKLLTAVLFISLTIPIGLVTGEPLYAGGFVAILLLAGNWALWRYRVMKFDRTYGPGGSQ